jgi:hypothetical protein
MIGIEFNVGYKLSGQTGFHEFPVISSILCNPNVSIGGAGSHLVLVED